MKEEGPPLKTGEKDIKTEQYDWEKQEWCFIFSEDLKLPFLGSLSYSVCSCVCVFGGVSVYQSVMCEVREMKPGVMLSDYHMS